MGSAAWNHPGETVRGDAWTAEWQAGGCRISVIEGLGHGPMAAFAAQSAVAALREHPNLSPLEALDTCQRALIGSRGAAISIVSLDPDGTHLRQRPI